MTGSELRAPADRPAVVTGASSGIGEASARLLAATGHPVVLGARRLDALERISAEINATGGTAYPVALDLADDASITSFAKQAEAVAGPVEVLVSNAGAIGLGDVMTMDRAEFEQHLNVNVLGTRALVQAIGAGMLERHRGDLIFVTSDVARAPRPGMAAYVASKSAVEAMVTALGMELEGSGVRVSCVRPGPTLTEMGWDWAPEKILPQLEVWKYWGLQRHMHFMTPADVAAAVGAVVGCPPGAVFSLVEVQPVPPYEPPATKE
jgi:NADP-dependent 3-hydroxy acid dehydrogenase YdfG